MTGVVICKDCPPGFTPQSAPYEDPLAKSYKDLLEHTHTTLQGERLNRGRIQLLQLVPRCLAPGWDGEDALAISEGAFDEAFRIITMLPNEVPLPHVDADPHGSINLEWDNGRGRNVIISVTGMGVMGYAAILGHANNREYGYKPFLMDSIPFITQLVHRIGI